MPASPPPANSQAIQAQAGGTNPFTPPWYTFFSSLLSASSTDTLTNKTFADPSNTLGGVTVVVGGDATGDIWYRNSSGIFTRLGIGSPAQILTVSGGLPAWATPAAVVSGLTYLGTVNTVANAIVDTPTGILSANNSAYRSFLLVLKNILPGTNGVTFLLQVHSGGTFQTTSYVSTTIGGRTTSSNVTNSTSGVILSAFNFANSGPGMSGEAHISNLAGTSTTKIWTGLSAGLDSGGSAGITSTFGGYWNGGNGAVDGFQIVPSSGNITSGSVDVYGIL